MTCAPRDRTLWSVDVGSDQLRGITMPNHDNHATHAWQVGLLLRILALVLILLATMVLGIGSKAPGSRSSRLPWPAHRSTSTT